jgi:anti-sigma factor RsiW
VKPEIELGAALRDALPTYKAPASLHDWARVQAAQHDLDIAPASNTRFNSTRWRMPVYAASLLIAGALGWGGNAVYQRNQEAAANQNAMVADLVDTHVRSLMQNHLIDVQSTDRHTVKPWFAGKVDFAPTVPDLSAVGFPLLGGRLEYIHGQTVAALVYGRRLHVVNVFVWPASGESGDDVSRKFRGYSVRHWVKSGLSYWAVTDAAATDLEAFQKAFEASS